MEIKTILVATDFSESSANAIGTAVEFAKDYAAQLVVLHAYKIEIPLASPMTGGASVLPTGFFERVGSDARARVEMIAKEIETQGVDAIGLAVEHSAAAAIVGEARSCSADLIVMGTRELTGLKHVAMGSVADRVARTAPCPVLTVGRSN